MSVVSEDWSDLQPTTSGDGDGEQAVLLARRVALMAFKKYGPARHSARLVLDHWNMRCDPPWTEEQLDAFLDHAVNETNAEQRREYANRPEARQARFRLAERRKAEAHRKGEAESNKRLAEALGTSVRYVRMLRSEGTTQFHTAQVMASVLGGKPSDYMRRGRKRGRQADLVALFMKAPAESCGFTDFVSDPPTLLGDAERDIITVFATRGVSDFESLEDMISFLGALDFETVDLAVAPHVWRAFKLWRIERIAAIACYAVEG